MLTNRLHGVAQQYQCSKGAAKIFLTNDADGNVGNANGKTDSCNVLVNAHKSVLKLLLFNKAGALAEDEYGNKILFVAAFDGNEPIVELLLDQFCVSLAYKHFPVAYAVQPSATLKVLKD